MLLTDIFWSWSLVALIYLIFILLNDEPFAPLFLMYSVGWALFIFGLLAFFASGVRNSIFLGWIPVVFIWWLSRRGLHSWIWDKRNRFVSNLKKWVLISANWFWDRHKRAFYYVVVTILIVFLLLSETGGGGRRYMQL